MPVVTVLPDRLELRLTTAERVLAFHRSDVVIDRASIRSATVTEDPWIWVRGIRAPGTAVPLTIAAGTWKFHGGKDFLLIKRTAAAVVIDLVGEEYSRIIVSTRHAPELIAALQLGPTTAAIPVIDTDDLVVVPEVAEQAARLAAEAEAEVEAEVKAEAVPPAPAKPAPKKRAAKPAADAPAEAKPSADEPTATDAPKKPAKPRARSPRSDASLGHASAEPSGATEAAE